MNIKLFGERVLVDQVKEEITGTLEIPQNVRTQTLLGQIKAVGDGVVRGANVPMYVAEGDIVMFQVNPAMIYNLTYALNGVKYLCLSQLDLIAKLKTAVVNFENFEPIGAWTLVEGFEEPSEKLIIIPDTVKDDRQMSRFRVVKAGAGVTKVSVGDEVIIERSRANEMVLNRTKYYYIDQTFIYGTNQE